MLCLRIAIYSDYLILFITRVLTFLGSHFNLAVLILVLVVINRLLLLNFIMLS